MICFDLNHHCVGAQEKYHRQLDTLIVVFKLYTGAASPPSNLNIIIASEPPVSLTWLAPPNGPTDCVFNYTINITNYSSSSSCYSTSNTESLILTDDLITRGHNYSFAVAVTDSAGQHGPWSDQLTVTYDGMNEIISASFYTLFVTSVPGIVSFIAQLQLTKIIVIWQVMNALLLLY